MKILWITGGTGIMQGPAQKLAESFVETGTDGEMLVAVDHHGDLAFPRVATYHPSHSKWLPESLKTPEMSVIVALRHVIVQNQMALADKRKYDAIVVLSPELRFKKKVLAHQVKGWFHHCKACFYLKNGRDTFDDSAFGFFFEKHAFKLAEALIQCYHDLDCNEKPLPPAVQLQAVLGKNPVSACDLAFSASHGGEVLQNSALSLFLEKQAVE